MKGTNLLTSEQNISFKNTLAFLTVKKDGHCIPWIGIKFRIISDAMAKLQIKRDRRKFMDNFP